MENQLSTPRINIECHAARQVMNLASSHITTLAGKLCRDVISCSPFALVPLGRNALKDSLSYKVRRRDRLVARKHLRVKTSEQHIVL